MEDFATGFSMLLVFGLLGLWVVSGFVGAAMLMYKGYTMEMFGCLGALYGGILALIAVLGPIILFIAWALPSRTDPTQEGGIKKMMKPKASRRSLPSSNDRPATPSRPSIRAPQSRRPQIPGSSSSRSRPAIPPHSSSRDRSKPPARRSGSRGSKPPTRS